MSQRRIQIYEYVTAEGARNPGFLAPSLLREGRAMLDALVEDFRRIEGIEVEILDDIPSRIDADGTLVVAPESDGILEAVARRAIEAGGRLLGPSPEAIRLTADKMEMGRHFERWGVATPRTEALSSHRETGGLTFPLVLKPRDGAGSQDTFLIRDATELASILPNVSTEAILQPFVRGLAASVAFLVGPKQCLPLMPCTQELSDDGRFRYLGGSLPLPPELAERAVSLGERAVRTVASLRGYVGVDLVLGEIDTVIEINPRLTTSYVGLRRACRGNLAEAMLKVIDGEECELTWDATPLRFEVRC